MKRILFILLFVFGAACADDTSNPIDQQGEIDAGVDVGVDMGVELPTLTFAPEDTYEWTERDIIYGQGQAHSAWLVDDPMPTDLEATIWEPVGAPEVKPALLIVHGGGFLGGTRTQAQLVDFAEYYVARGWFVMSIDYRTLGDYPTVPQTWFDGVEAQELNSLFTDIGKTIYGSTRDGKAAVRYMQANADEFGIDPNQIAAMGGSAGSFISIALGVTEPEDFRDEFTVEEDPTLASTNLEQTGRVVAVLDHWGGPEAVDGLEFGYGLDRWDDNDAPIQIVHGTDDQTVEPLSAEIIRDHYIENDRPYTFYMLEGAGHGPWDAELEGVPLIEAGHAFLVEQMELVEE